MQRARCFFTMKVVVWWGQVRVEHKKLKILCGEVYVFESLKI